MLGAFPASLWPRQLSERKTKMSCLLWLSKLVASCVEIPHTDVQLFKFWMSARMAHELRPIRPISFLCLSQVNQVLVPFIHWALGQEDCPVPATPDRSVHPCSYSFSWKMEYFFNGWYEFVKSRKRGYFSGLQRLNFEKGYTILHVSVCFQPGFHLIKHRAGRRIYT